MTKKVTTMLWHDMTLVKISDVGEDFKKWLYGQTVPYVEEDINPFDWAYSWDYDRYVKHLPIID